MRHQARALGASIVDVATQEVTHADRPSPPRVKKPDDGCQAHAWDEGGRGLGVRVMLGLGSVFPLLNQEMIRSLGNDL
jgi:hypothetical protein